MEQNIQKQLKIIQESNNWIHTYLNGEKGKNAYRNIVTCRRKLNKKKFSLEGNPAAAIYGASQMGKSYLVGSLLSENGKPFTVIDGNNNEHDFINKINPIGKKTEATSLVTRFSTKYEWINPSFPIKAKLLSPADLILVLCDSYYNDIKIKIDTALQSEFINEKVSGFYNRFSNRPPQQFILTEDHILDIQDYFDKNFSTKTTRIKDSKFFIEIPFLIDKIKTSEWVEVFALLWNNNHQITNILTELFIQYEKLGFPEEVYLPFESVLREHGTMLDVARLHEIYGKYNGSEEKYTAQTTVMILENGKERNISNFSKSYLCALTAELVFNLPKKLNASKHFLENTDLLDFPGARNRLGVHEEEILNEDVPKILLRGKVAFLFNKYSDSEKINILLFCQNNEKSEVQNILPQLINDWIEEMIGETAEQRNLFIQKSKIPPLFIISTMFNIDLQYDYNNDTPANTNFRESRWSRRFSTVFNEVFGSKNWLYEWTLSSPNFQNIYLLRDFFYSSDTESKIFKGYNEQKTESEEIIPQNYPNFRKDLRQSFIDNYFVKNHFTNPVESWDEAASINKDGSQLIIDKLTLAANNINRARYEKSVTELNEISQTILCELFKYYHSNDKDEELQKAKSIAGNIQYKLAEAFSADGIKYYGQLMKELMVDESVVLELYRKKINDIEYQEVVNLDIYSTHRINVPVMEGDTINSYFERLCAHYEKTTDDQKQQFRTELETKGIDLGELISGNSELIKNNAQQLADALLEYWFVYINLNDKYTIQRILSQEGSSALQEITDMYQKLFKKVGIAKKIAERIRSYIDVHTKTDLPFELIADMSAELLNKCIRSVGFDYFDESEINDLRLANEQNKLGLVLDHNENPTENSVEELFQKIEKWSEIIQSKPEEMKSLPSYRNYLAWYNQLKTGFVAVCNIPNYDIQANERLGAIIKEAETVKFS
jgi:hypothetical protein